MLPLIQEYGPKMKNKRLSLFLDSVLLWHNLNLSSFLKISTNALLSFNYARAESGAMPYQIPRPNWVLIDSSNHILIKENNRKECKAVDKS